MSTATIPNVFVSNTIIQSATMNANFAYLIGILNTNLLPPIGTANSVVTTDGSGNMQASTIASFQPLTTKGDLYTFTTVPAREPVGADGTFLTADSTQTTGLKWSAISGSLSAAQTYNLGLNVSASAGVLTVAVTQQDGTSAPTAGSPVALGIRNPSAPSGAFNVRTLTSTLSQTVSLQTTLNMMAGKSGNLYAYAIDSDGLGTMKLGFSSILFDDSLLSSTVKESTTATITIASPGVITETGHGRVPGDAVQFTTTGALPTGLTVATTYYILSATTNTYQLTAFPLDNVIATSGSQSGVHTVHTAGTNLVSGAVYTNVPIRLIGRLKFTLTTSGTWIAPTVVSLVGNFDNKESIYLQGSRSISGSVTSGNAVAFDVTIAAGTNMNVNRPTGSVSCILIPKSGQYGFRVVVNPSATTTISLNVNFTTTYNIVTASSGVFSTGSYSIFLNRNDAIFIFSNNTATFAANDLLAVEYLGPAA